MGRRPSVPRGLTEISLEDAVAKFLDYAKAHATKSTVANRRVILNRLIESLSPDRQVWRLERADFTNAMTSIINGANEEEMGRRREAGMHPRSGRTTRGSQAQVRTVLWQFARFCHEQRWLDKEVTPAPKELIRTGKRTSTGSAAHHRFPEEQWPEVLEVAGRRHMRARMMAALGFAGRRASEAIRVQLKHVSLEQRTIEYWIQKSDRPLMQPLIPLLRAEIELWMEWARSTYGEPQGDWYLIPARATPDGKNSRLGFWRDPRLYPVDMTKPSNTLSIQKDVAIVLEALGVPVGNGLNGTHTFRRSAATAATVKSGIYVAKALLDHATVATTQIYVGIGQDFNLLRDAMMSEAQTPAELPDNVHPIHRRKRNEAS